MFTGIESQIESNDNKMDYLFLSHGHWSHDDIHSKKAKRSEQIKYRGRLDRFGTK